MGDHHGMGVVHAEMSDMMAVYSHGDMADIALAQPVRRVKSRSKKTTASRNGTRCKECGCAICMKDRQSVAKSAGATQKPCPASPARKQAWIDANDGKLPNRPSRSKVTQCVQCGEECWKTVPLATKKSKSKKLGGLAKSSYPRSSRRCKECGCALCEGKSPQKPCEATEQQRAMWLEANGGRALSRPSRSKIMRCVRCTDKCWEMAAANSMGQRRKSGHGSGKKTTQRTRKNRRCKVCGCANCDGRSTGACSATPAQRQAWIRANGNKSLSRPARSKVEMCTRCNQCCWAQGEGGAPLKLVAKKNRGRNYRSKMRCKTCGCAECVARRPPKDTHCDATMDIQTEWRRLNGNKLPARPSRSKAKSCLRCHKNCWRIGPEARKKAGDANGVSMHTHTHTHTHARARARTYECHASHTKRVCAGHLVTIFCVVCSSCFDSNARRVALFAAAKFAAVPSVAAARVASATRLRTTNSVGRTPTVARTSFARRAPRWSSARGATRSAGRRRPPRSASAVAAPRWSPATTAAASSAAAPTATARRLVCALALSMTTRRGSPPTTPSR